MSAKIKLIYYIQLIIDFFNLRVVKKKIINFEDNFNLSKVNLLYCNIVINYKLDDLITTSGIRLGSEDDPYHYALKHSLPIIKKNLFIETFVRQIKLKIRKPRKASEALGFGDSKVLANYPEWSLVMPWDEILIEEKYKTYVEQFIKKRSTLKKLNEKLSEKNGDFIMYNELTWESHAEQFYKLYKSISKNSLNNIKIIPVNLFVYENQYRLSLSDDGNHRARIAYLMNLKSIPLRLSKIINFSDMQNWTNVKNNFYSLQEAKKIFIDYFNYNGEGSYV